MQLGILAPQSLQLRELARIRTLLPVCPLIPPTQCLRHDAKIPRYRFHRFRLRRVILTGISQQSQRPIPSTAMNIFQTQSHHSLPREKQEQSQTHIMYWFLFTLLCWFLG